MLLLVIFTKLNTFIMKKYISPLLISCLLIACRYSNANKADSIKKQIQKEVLNTNSPKNFYGQLADSALTLTKENVRYDPAYFEIGYPNGDVPKGKGVCTDVIIRAFRKMKIDLQKEVHEDMKTNFALYPKKWGLSAPNKSIDHRRVPNLLTFFNRHGNRKSITTNSEDYYPGDIVCWNLGGAITHIGIVTNQLSDDQQRHLIVHNIGAGQVLEDCLFNYKIIGHYSYKP
jgi:uncharacterized protein